MTAARVSRIVAIIAAAVIGFLQITEDFVRLYVALVRQLLRSATAQINAI